MHAHHKDLDPTLANEFDWNDAYTGERSDYEPPDADLLEVLERMPPGRALDVGCGAGGLVLALAERGWDVTGIDIAGRAIESARDLLSHHGVTAELIVADAARWDAAGEYDAIVSCFALPERPRRDDCLRMMSGALAPGGILGVKEFDSTMARHAFFAGFDLPTLEELTDSLPDLDIESAEVVETPVHEHAERDPGTPGTDSTDAWTAALILARRPGRAEPQS